MEKRFEKPKVLIFEDDPLLLDIFPPKFKEFGFEVRAFKTYDNVVKVVSEELPDIIYCDIIMPTIDGWEAIKLLKADARTKGIPIIIVDNMCQREEVQKGLELGVVYHCCKAQYTPAEVANIFRDQLMKRDPDYRDKFNTESYY